eukprot:6468039-Amphidinium_carterae.1
MQVLFAPGDGRTLRQQVLRLAKLKSMEMEAPHFPEEARQLAKQAAEASQTIAKRLAEALEALLASIGEESKLLHAASAGAQINKPKLADAVRLASAAAQVRPRRDCHAILVLCIDFGAS